MILAMTPSIQVLHQQYWQNVGVTLASTSGNRIQLCGPTVIEKAGERLDALLPGPQGRRLFAYLVLNRHRTVNRGELVEALWRTNAPPASASSLNALLSKLRRVFGADAIDGRSDIRLVLEGDFWIDV